MNALKRLVFFLFFGLMSAPSLQAQNLQQLRDAILQQQQETRTEIEQIDDLISQFERRLNEARREYEKVYEQYENLERLLALQQQKVSAMQKEQRQINSEIAVTERKLQEQEKMLETLIEEYKETMRYLYKNGRTSQLALILSSESVNQMMVRNYYLKKFENYREGQADEIRQTQAELKESQQQLDQAAVRNKELLAEIQVEEKSLEKRTKQQEANVKILRQDIEKNKQRLAQERQNRQEFRDALARYQAREQEIRQKLKEQQQENMASSNNSDNAAEENATDERPVAENTTFLGETGFFSEEELQRIETSFAAQKGALPWPVQSSTISEHFGRKRHPVYGTVTENLGIEIVTQARDEVRVVHDGRVFAVQPLTGYGDVVFVSHGKFITAYGNLSRVLVRQNTILEQGDLIGYSGDQNSTRGESVFFMLRNGSQNVDPESWIKNK